MLNHHTSFYLEWVAVRAYDYKVHCTKCLACWPVHSPGSLSQRGWFLISVLHSTVNALAKKTCHCKVLSITFQHWDMCYIKVYIIMIIIIKKYSYQVENRDLDDIITYVHVHVREIHLWIKYEAPWVNGVVAMNKNIKKNKYGGPNWKYRSHWHNGLCVHTWHLDQYFLRKKLLRKTAQFLWTWLSRTHMATTLKITAL